MMEIKAVQLPDMLACREARAVKQWDLIERYKRPVVSFSMNIAGEIKNTPAISMLQRDGAEEFKAAAAEAGLTLLHEDRSDSFTGPESLLVFGWPGSAQTGNAREGEVSHPSARKGEATHLSAVEGASLLKDIGVRIEEETPWGRLYDIDIIGTDGEKLSRPSPRRCIVCSGPAADCARSRAHGLDQIREKTDELIAQYLGDSLGTAAASALVREAALTPKPGLVDAANNGAHKDMDLELLLASASSLRPFFAQMAGFSAAYGPDILTLVKVGKNAEKAMFRATRGVNAHKGAIFAFAL
ncbi:MAG: citrate lyase holo-[acyl-carrier protein] synthase, partial [Clostridia bacterium]|nr:citrate lyase holo-[acyl-carrier protein] synthase [Clostridia bacterium]